MRSMLDIRRHFGRLSVCVVKCALSVPDEEKKESSGGVEDVYEEDEEDEGATLAMEES